MRNILQSLLQHPVIQKVRQRYDRLTAPVRTAWASFSAPLRTALAPAVAAWDRLTAPLRERWATFTGRYPLAGTVAYWSGRLVKWGITFLLLLILGVGLGFFGRLPGYDELRNIENANATEVYSVDSVLIGKFYIQNRTTIDLEKISVNVINALVATEDHRFFVHRGIDFTSWIRVGFGMLSGKQTGGGSTLSQQLAKNLYPRRNYRVPGLSLLINKIRENYISLRLERIYSKEELLSLYLNTVPFGGDIYGISVAARSYFGKTAKELSPDQAATLIGMLKATTFYNPVRNPENARRRRNIVLQQMVKNGHLKQTEYEQLIEKPVGARRHHRNDNNDGAATYFREHLRTEVMPRLLKKHPRPDGTNYNLYTDGLRIYTTIHSQMQGFAEKAVNEHMKKLQEQFDKHWKSIKKEKPWGDDKWIADQIKRSERWGALKDAGLNDAEATANFEQPVRMTIFSLVDGGTEVDTTMSPIDSVRHYFCLLNCGFLAMDHRNGYVRAWVGGTNFKYFKFDHIKSRRQVGSTFKPIIYAAAIQKGIGPCDYIPNELVQLGDWEPHNSDDIYGGYYSVVGALAGSINVVAAQLIEKAGIQRTIDMASKMGVKSTLPREYGISLGAAEVSLYDMIKVYGTMANKGVRPDPVVVLKVTTREGEVIYQYDPEKEQSKTAALTPDEATIMTEMLQNVINHGTGGRMRYGYGLHGEFAGKTGTTQNHSDGWFICYNPQLVTGAWVGGESPAVRFRSMSLGQGASMALPIVAMFWHNLAQDKKLGRMLQEKFPEPKEEIAAQFDCPFFIDVSPDTLQMMLQDSTLRDSLALNGYENLKERFAEFFGDGEGGSEDEEQEKRKEKRRDFFEKLLGRQPDEKKEKNKPEGGRQ